MTEDFELRYNHNKILAILHNKRDSTTNVKDKQHLDKEIKRHTDYMMNC